MTLNIFTVFDSKAGLYLQPFFSQSTGTAIREFSSAANTSEHAFHIHASDFTLFHLGEFDQADGKFNLLNAPASLGTAIQYIALPEAGE